MSHWVAHHVPYTTIDGESPAYPTTMHGFSDTVWLIAAEGGSASSTGKGNEYCDIVLMERTVGASHTVLDRFQVSPPVYSDQVYLVGVSDDTVLMTWATDNDQSSSDRRSEVRCQAVRRAGSALETGPVIKVGEIAPYYSHVSGWINAPDIVVCGMTDRAAVFMGSRHELRGIDHRTLDYLMFLVDVASDLSLSKTPDQTLHYQELEYYHFDNRERDNPYPDFVSGELRWGHTHLGSSNYDLDHIVMIDDTIVLPWQVDREWHTFSNAWDGDTGEPVSWILPVSQDLILMAFTVSGDQLVHQSTVTWYQEYKLDHRGPDTNMNDPYDPLGPEDLIEEALMFPDGDGAVVVWRFSFEEWYDPDWLDGSAIKAKAITAGGGSITQGSETMVADYRVLKPDNEEFTSVSLARDATRGDRIVVPRAGYTGYYDADGNVDYYDDLNGALIVSRTDLDVTAVEDLFTLVRHGGQTYVMPTTGDDIWKDEVEVWNSVGTFTGGFYGSGYIMIDWGDEVYAEGLLVFLPAETEPLRVLQREDDVFANNPGGPRVRQLGGEPVSRQRSIRAHGDTYF